MLGAFARNAGGNMATLFALFLPVLFGVAALAVDQASLHLEKRRLQHAVDMAAIHAASAPGRAEAWARQALIDRGYDPQSGALTVEMGHYTPDPARLPAERFIAGAPSINAARVSLTQPGTLHFASAFGMAPPTIAARATASATPRAAFSIGSRLASLDGGVANALLGQLLGTTLSFTLADYRGIADVEIGLFDFLDGLASRIGVSAGTYGDVLDAKVKLADIAAALSAASGGKAMLATLAGRTDPALVVDMARLVVADDLADLTLGSAATGGMAAASLNAMQLLTASALLADGSRQLSLDLGFDIPGLTAVSVRLVVGEPPQGGWFTLGGEGSFVRTAQMRLRIDFSLLGQGGGLGLLAITLPVYVELAPASARLASLSCPPGRPDLAQAGIDAIPGIARLAIGAVPQADFLDTTRPLAIAKTPIVTLLGGIARVTARADVSASQTAPVRLDFTAADAEAGTVRTARTSTPLSSLSASLLGATVLELEILQINLLGALLSGATGIVKNLITPLAPAIDTVLTTLLDMLGLGIGEADVRVHGFDCRMATLVQ